jgi:hypothetical protein
LNGNIRCSSCSTCPAPADVLVLDRPCRRRRIARIAHESGAKRPILHPGYAPVNTGTPQPRALWARRPRR